MNKEYKINKMGVMPVQKLVISMGVPMMLSMIIQAVYNIADSYFVSGIGRVMENEIYGDYAVNAVTLAFPVQILMIAIGVGTGIGVNSVLSKTLGEGDREKTSKVSGNAIFTGICVYVLFLLFGKFGIDSYLSTQTHIMLVKEMAEEYLIICTEFSFGAILFMIYEKLLQSTGKTTQSMIIQISGAVINIILDPVLIFGYGIFPQMGIKGAAYATITGQIFSFILGLIFHKIYNSREFETGIKYIKPDLQIIKEIYRVGFPAVIMQAMTSLMTYGVNIILGTVSPELVTSYGIYYKIQQFVFFMAAGMNNALIPIIAYNFGSKNIGRIREAILYGMKYTVFLMISGTILLEAGAVGIMSAFELTDKAREISIIAIRTGSLAYVFTGANVIVQGVMQALGKGTRALVLSFFRMILILFPVIYGLSLHNNPESYVWFAFPISEITGFILAFYLLKKTEKEKLQISDILNNL